MTCTTLAIDMFDRSRPDRIGWSLAGEAVDLAAPAA